MSSGDTNIRVNIKGDAATLNRVIKQMAQLDKWVKKSSKSVTKLNTENKKLKATIDSLKGKLTKANKSIKQGAAAMNKMTSAASKSKGKLRGVEGALKGVDAAAKKSKASLGFTGLAFGFIGGIASFALGRIKQFGQEILEVGVEDLGSMNRAIVQSGINIDEFLKGNKTEFNAMKKRIQELQKLFPEFSLAEVAKGVERIVKALPDSAGAAEVERFSKALLVIQRIEGGDPAKLAVDLRRAAVQFGISGDELGFFVDQLVNVNQQSSIELNQLVSSLGFAGAQAQRFGLTAGETLAITGLLFDKGGRKAGAAGRTFSRVLEEMTQTGTLTNGVLKALKINVLDSANNFRPFTDIIDESRIAFAKLTEEHGDLAGSAFLEEFGLDSTSARGFLALMQTSKEELDELIKTANTPGTANSLSDAIGEGADVKLKSFDNEVRLLKTAFVTGLIPSIVQLNEVIKEFSEDDDLTKTLSELASAIGGSLLVVLRIIVPIVKTFANILKDNQPIVNLLAGSIVALVTALAGLTIIAPILGALFAWIFLQEKLAVRFVFMDKLLKAQVSLLQKLGGALSKPIGPIKKFAKFLSKNLTGGLKNVSKTVNSQVIPSMRGLGKAISNSRVIRNLQAGFQRLIGVFIGAAIRMAVFFGAAFNIVAAAFIGAGTWLAALFTGLQGRFLGAGVGVGLAFGHAFTVVSAAVMSAGAWLIGLIKNLQLRLALAGGVAGGAFGGAFTAISAAIMRAGGWISGVMASIRGKMIVGAALAGGLFGGIFTAISGGIMRAGGWILGVMTTIGLQMAAGAAAIGAFFGGIWTASVRAIMIAGGWLLAVFTAIGTKMSIAAAALGGLFGGIWTAVARVFMVAGAWLTSVFARIGIASGIGGTAAGSVFGIAFGVAAATALIAIILAGIDIMIESISGGSILRSITDAIFGKGQGFSARDALGIPQQGTSLVGSAIGRPLTPQEAADQKRRKERFGKGGLLDPNAFGGEGINSLEQQEGLLTLGPSFFEGIFKKRFDDEFINSFGQVPPAFGEEGEEGIGPDFTEFENSLIQLLPEDESAFMIGDIDLRNQLDAIMGEQNFAMDTQIGAINEQIAGLIEGIEFTTIGNGLSNVSNGLSLNENKLLVNNNKLVDIENLLTATYNVLLFKLIEKVEVQVLEVARNINLISSLTSVVANVNLMFANLIAQGNRAAGKLASLRVSAKGVFSISDPGVSSFDQSNINDAETNLSETIANQVNFILSDIKAGLTAITQPVKDAVAANTNNNVTVTNNFNIAEFEGLTSDEILEKIQEMQAEVLLENFPVS